MFKKILILTTLLLCSFSSIAFAEVGLGFSTGGATVGASVGASVAWVGVKPTSTSSRFSPALRVTATVPSCGSSSPTL